MNARRALGVVALLVVCVGGWFMLARLGAFAPLGRKLGTRIPGDRYSYTFIPSGKFCTDSARRCFFVNLGDRTMAPVLGNDAEGFTFTITNSVTDRSDFKASYQQATYEIVVIDGDHLHIRAPEVADGNWIEFSRR